MYDVLLQRLNEHIMGDATQLYPHGAQLYFSAVTPLSGLGNPPGKVKFLQLHIWPRW